VASDPARGIDELTFEAAVERLDEIVGRLERGEAPLEEILSMFEEGVLLARRCQALLADAEERVRRLVPDGGGFALESFEPGEDDA
jgi:exodeoxyribonuclease VII small subunit